MGLRLALVVFLLAAASGGPSTNGLMDDEEKAATVQAGWASQAQALASQAAQRAAVRLWDYERAPRCRDAAAVWVKGSADGTCPAGTEADPYQVVCEGGLDVVRLPMWARHRLSEVAPWSAWAAIDLGGCGDGTPVLTVEDLRRLPLPAPVLRMQPDGWTLVNLETVVMTDGTPVLLRTDLLGFALEVEVTPQRFTYEFGDGSEPLVTTSAGRPYPHHDTFHVYRQAGTVQVTLTAHWSGRYRLAGAMPWREITGTATTSTTGPPVQVEERRAYLVDDLCTDVPRPDDC